LESKHRYKKHVFPSHVVHFLYIMTLPVMESEPD